MAEIVAMPTGRVFAYGLLGMPLAFAALPLYVHLPHFYAATVGMEMALLGSILLVARLLDAGIDPWLGWLADRVRRPWMVGLCLIPFALGFVALFHPPQTHAALWLLGALALTYLGYSGATVAYQAWGAAVGGDSIQRTRLVASREGFGLVGVLLAAALPALIASNLQEGMARLTWVLPPLLLAAACITFCVVGTRSSLVAPRQTLLSSVQAVLRIAPFRRLLLVFVANGIAAALPATLFLFFVADILMADSASGGLLALYFVAGAASLPAWLAVARHHGRVKAWSAGMVLSIAGFAGAGTLGVGETGLFALVCLASGLALGADLALPTSLAADLGESRGHSGACFGVWNFAAKLNLALAAGLALPLLGLLGYVPGSGQGLDALILAYAVLPLLFKLLALGLLWHWRHALEITS